MKTIEERADAYVGHPFEIDEFTSASLKRQAFIDGAKEQRKIDTDKAERAFSGACGWLNVYPWYIAVKDEFRKAMGE